MEKCYYLYANLFKNRTNSSELHIGDQLLVLCTLILIALYQRPITVNGSLIVVFAYFLIGQKFIHYYHAIIPL